jgi:hypothetical protein
LEEGVNIMNCRVLVLIENHHHDDIAIQLEALLNESGYDVFLVSEKWQNSCATDKFNRLQVLNDELYRVYPSRKIIYAVLTPDKKAITEMKLMQHPLNESLYFSIKTNVADLRDEINHLIGLAQLEGLSVEDPIWNSVPVMLSS